ncbi:conserved hypothetical protein [Flavobacterium sp. 9AF]|nr:conserved hypothetical protein [Flavobacterium sp. 9AF]
MCINEPTLYTKNPNAQPIISMTATRYNKFDILIFFIVIN